MYCGIFSDKEIRLILGRYQLYSASAPKTNQDIMKTHTQNIKEDKKDPVK
jgi:hypothetical protein